MTRWRYYVTPAGANVVRGEIDDLGEEAAAALLDLMRRARRDALFAREQEHIGGDLFALRCFVGGMTYRLLYAREGQSNRILLALHAFNKTSERLPKKNRDLALKRLASWRSAARGA